MANDYTTLANVKAQIPESGIGSTTDYDALLTSLITSSSRMIDKYLGVQAGYFYPTTDDVTRYYDGNNSDELKIDDFVSITSLGVAEQGGLQSTDYFSWTSTDYYTHPYNAVANGQPYNTLVVDVENGEKSYFPRYRKAIKVTGIFGFSTTTPELIAQACMTQTLHWYMRAKNAWQNKGANEQFLVDTGGKLDEDVKTMLNGFMLDRL